MNPSVRQPVRACRVAAAGWLQASLAVWLLATGCGDEKPADVALDDTVATGDTVTDAALSSDASSHDADAQLAPDISVAPDGEPQDTTQDTQRSSPDIAPPDASQLDTGLADSVKTDSGQTDSGQTDAGQTDAGQADTAAQCPTATNFDYKCDPTKPKTCPGGLCSLGSCIGPKLNQDRWKDCGDGVCGPCESANGCPADCGKPPQLIGTKDYNGKDTITIWVHGFYNKNMADLAKMTYGQAEGCGGILKMLKTYGVDLPCGDTDATAKLTNHAIEVEYYGSKPAAWLSKDDIAAIDKWPFDKGALGLQRYALIVAKFARWRMKLSGAKHINFGCHSMGCLITRHLIENDYEQLASQSVIVRWATNTGVIAGARLARLYDNPDVQKIAAALSLELSDFVLMNPDYVMDVTAVWDHKLYAGNNPLLQGILIHHTAATDPKIQTAFGTQLLDLNNPGDEPNDGIMYTLDEFFATQDKHGVTLDKAGKAVPSTRSFTFLDHMNNPKGDAAGLLSTAGLFHSRKVVITLAEVELYDDLEKDNPLDIKQQGLKPAEIAAEVAVTFDPYVAKTFSKSVLVHQARTEHRSAELFTMAEKDIKKPELVLFSGPVFDAMTSLKLSVWLLEMDWYPRFGVQEWIFDKHQQLAAWSGDVQLQDGTFEFKNKNVRAVVRVVMHTMY